MNAEAGMVMIQATTMLFATFQRTADTLRAAPTPMMQPVMVCVVETGTPSSVAANKRDGAAGLGAKALEGRKPRDARAHGPHDPPAAEQGAEPHRRVACEHDPERHVKFTVQIALRIEQHRDDAHGFLGVVPAVTDGIERSGDQLQRTEQAIDREGRVAHEQP